MSRSPTFVRLQHLFQRARAHAGVAAPGGPSRREVLAGLGAALAASQATQLQGCAGPAFTVAVVGAGLAGTHAAYRLHQAGVDVTLYEAADRLGGRTFTGRGLFADGQLCELGGELIDSNHATMWALAAELDLTLDDRIGGAYAVFEPETFWVYGAKVSEETLLEQLTAVAADIQADYDAAETDDAAFEALDAETLADWLERRVPQGTYLELHTVLTAAYRGEFGLEASEQSALNLVYLIGLDTDAFRVFGDSDERFHAHEGSDVFVARMADALPGQRLLTRHTLTKASGEGPYTLVFQTPDGEVTASCDHLVLALPFSTLREVDTAGLALSDEKRALVEGLGYGTNAKVMGGFSRPVWRDDHDALGAVTGDLTFQQTWDSSLGQAGEGAILTNFLGGELGRTSDDREPDAWFDEIVLSGLEGVYPGVRDAYVAGSAVRMHWPTVPTAKGSYTCYRPGQWAFWPLEGEREGNVHVCGEHASADFQGWMEGAAESGLRVATEILDDHGLSLPEAARRLAVLRRRLPPLARGSAGLRALRERRAWTSALADLVRTGASLP